MIPETCLPFIMRNFSENVKAMQEKLREEQNRVKYHNELFQSF